jgi:hypothetical protein
MDGSKPSVAVLQDVFSQQLATAWLLAHPCCVCWEQAAVAMESGAGLFCWAYTAAAAAAAAVWSAAILLSCFAHLAQQVRSMHM